ncbi:MAG TPA: DUF885 family protein, partial [Candidatus Acidoferrales bacterium]|nr:DUF885 family protein [Candidatus Acidoferrales bacterium]
MKSIFVLAAATLLFSVVVASDVAQTRTSNAAENATTRLRTFLASDWKYWVGQYPENATAFGYAGENNRWTDYSPEAIASRNQHLHQSLAELEAIPHNALPVSEQLNYDLYREQLQLTIEGLKYHGDAFPLQTEFPTNLYTPLNQMGGVQQYIPDVIAQMSMDKASDYRDLIARLNGIPAVINQNIALMKIGMARG